MTEDQAAYSYRYLRFARAHWEAFKAAELDQSSSSANEMLRLEGEYRNLPPGHDCTCWCPQERRGYQACPECRRIRANAVKQDIGPGVLSRRPVETGTVPLVVVLDMEAGYAQ